VPPRHTFDDDSSSEDESDVDPSNRQVSEYQDGDEDELPRANGKWKEPREIKVSLAEEIKNNATVVIGVDLLSGVGEWFGESRQVGTIDEEGAVYSTTSKLIYRATPKTLPSRSYSTNNTISTQFQSLVAPHSPPPPWSPTQKHSPSRTKSSTLSIPQTSSSSRHQTQSPPQSQYLFFAHQLPPSQSEVSQLTQTLYSPIAVTSPDKISKLVSLRPTTLLPPGKYRYWNLRI
jgi:hypothetical protein